MLIYFCKVFQRNNVIISSQPDSMERWHIDNIVTRYPSEHRLQQEGVQLIKARCREVSPH